ncbi:MFS transporter [Yersinia pestis]|nr:MFS transporter [Yersinia pestis]
MMKWKQRTGILVGNMFEFYDIAVYAAISTYLAEILTSKNVDHAETLIWGIFGLRFVIRPLGGTIIGWFADLYGRKKALIVTSSLTGSATLLMAMLPTGNTWFPFFLLILQMVQAFSFGGEYPTAISYLLKDEKKQTIISAAIVASSVAGVILSLIVTTSLSRVLTHDDMLQYGWRIPLAIGAVNIAISFWFRWRLKVETTTVPKGSIAWYRVVRIFLMTVPAAVVFYVQSLSVSMVKMYLPEGNTRELFPLIANVALFAILLISGIIIQKFSTPEKAMRAGIFSLICMATPLYMGLSSEYVLIVAAAQFLLTVLASIILSTLAILLFKESLQGQHQSAELGLGYNLALSVFGGLSPLVISLLIPVSPILVGGYVALSGLVWLAGCYIPGGNNKGEA